MKYFFFVALLAVAHCSQVSELRELIQSFNYGDAETDKLISHTRDLIQTTKTEMESLQSTAFFLMETNLKSLDGNIRKLSDYSNGRTTDLINYLKAEIDEAVSHKKVTDPVKEECLVAYDYLTTLQTAFDKRLEVSLTTAIRNANATVRKNFNSMDLKISELLTLNITLDKCDEISACVLEVSDKAVEYNTEFIQTFNDINSEMISVPQDALKTAISGANYSVYEDEDYACNSATIMMSCIASFDDNTTDTSTTWLPPDIPTSSTMMTPSTSTQYTSTKSTNIRSATTASTMMTPSTSTQYTITTSTNTPHTENPNTSPITSSSTLPPNEYCTHQAFNPDINY